MTSAVRAGGTSSESTAWTSESCVLGKLVAGNFRSRVAIITASNSHAGMHGSQTFALSYDSPVMVECAPPNREISSSQSLTIKGAEMRQVAYSLKARIGGSNSEATNWNSETVMFLRSTVVTIGNTQLALTAGKAVSSLTESFFFDEKFLSGVGKGNAATTGSPQ